MKKKTLSRPGSETPAEKEARERSRYNAMRFYVALVRRRAPGAIPADAIRARGDR